MSFKQFSKQMLSLISSILIGVSLVACETITSRSSVKSTAQNEEYKNQAHQSSAPKKLNDNSAALPKYALSKDLLYDLLLAEFASQRGQYALAFDKYYAAAVQTRDSRLAKKATRVSLFSKNELQTFQSVKLWSEIEPDNIDVQQIFASSLIKKRRDDEAVIYLQKIVNLSTDFADGLTRVVNILDTIKEQQRVINIYTQVSKNHQDKLIVKLYWAKISIKFKDYTSAEKYLYEILSVQPDYLKALLVKVELLKKQKKKQQAIVVLQTILNQSPDNISVRLELIRLLVAINSYDEGFKQVQILGKKEIAPEVLFAISLLSIEMEQLDASKAYLVRLYHYKLYKNEAAYFIAQIEAGRKNYAEAESWFKKVNHGKYTFEAYLGLIAVYSQQQKTEQALQLLEHSRASSDKQNIDVLQIKAEVYSNAKQYKVAYEIYTEALKLAPGNSDLLYGRAMLAEKFDRIDLLEKDLLTIIHANPRDNQALNALGYTLTEKTQRYQEAYEYIEKALKINPADVATLDSMGWVLHKLGDNNRAEKYLRKAYEKDPDPEIAAHFGKVLWLLGKTREAKLVWNKALKKDPQHEILLTITTPYLK